MAILRVPGRRGKLHPCGRRGPRLARSGAALYVRGMRYLLLIPALAASLLGQPAAAQAPEDDVIEVVTRLFDGMRAADTTAMRATFHPDIRLVTTGTREGRPVATVVPVEQWLAGVAGTEAVLDERIHDPVVQVADGLATVWTFYTLHVGDRFSHCGVDAFQLVRTEDGWKIIEVADTRRREGCDVPDEARPEEGS